MTIRPSSYLTERKVGDGQTVISSLFSYNPKIDQSAVKSAPNVIEKPSNAPLTDSSTFTGLGIDPLIATHLSTKMDIQKPTSIQRAALPAIISNSASKDVFIQSQTGSGKTLSFLLPIIQDLLPLSSNSYIDRSIGTLAIIIAPTRELATQISDVLTKLLTMRLRTAEDTDGTAPESTRLTRWLVSGLLTGGATRAHEKARLRRGVPILVATPGRLLDHLQNTVALDVGKCRWLVLDEADRLMELGFEETVKGIVQGLDGRRKLALQAVKDGQSKEVGGWDWERERRTILCSATMKEDVQKLAGTTLRTPIMVRATEADIPLPTPSTGATTKDCQPIAEKFTPPSQLSQKYMVVPLKLRLVTLIALLRSLLAQANARRGSKIIVFLSCTDSVDFHWKLLTGCSMGGDEASFDSASDSNSDSELDVGEEGDSDDSSQSDEKVPEGRSKRNAHVEEKIEARSPLLPETSIFRLHGSLPLQTRLASLRGFSAVPSAFQTSVLLCTSVASRGLDLPLVRAVVQYDLPTEGGATEYVHRVGRTARAGKGGEAWSIVAPSEASWVEWVEGRMKGADKEDGSKGKVIKLDSVKVEDILKRGFGGAGIEFEERATEIQLAFERWTLAGKTNSDLAKRAFQSHMRAYATHPSDEKHIFHIRHLHLGHLAKAFALREAPSAVAASNNKAKSKARGQARVKAKKEGVRFRDNEEEDADAEGRMRKAVRAQGRTVKKGGMMRSMGTDEFQLASGYDLEKLVNRT
ncbi:hypothetical protein HETIRDRAFT_123078 [Heterobasidion irregulare TC 32-1]|uniref:ATP-dependent RNA helicase n=1 Tax=Heterobasidion irregulare (strain TC 32-1) TaxID=747525 RepID=W4K660_HETIT|nr:uncharacterized protein HETIRDRAFT_123078 [Heterobasidion irregulare TC 32-1]ETW80556.1 hypothetical protein HETIRDRAFT_123078 [Heterobasidion irregulare TC 32-1]